MPDIKFVNKDKEESEAWIAFASAMAVEYFAKDQESLDTESIAWGADALLLEWRKRRY